MNDQDEDEGDDCFDQESLDWSQQFADCGQAQPSYHFDRGDYLKCRFLSTGSYERVASAFNDRESCW